MGRFLPHIGLGLLLVLARGWMGPAATGRRAPAAFQMPDALPAGELDPSFGGFGDGGRLVAGSDGSDFVVARLLPDGGLDAGFGLDGVARVDFAGRSDFANALALDGAGRIVVAGSCRTGPLVAGIVDMAVARLNADGTPDNGFSGDGQVLIDFHGERDFAQAVVVFSSQPLSGTIVVAGSAGENSGFCAPACPTNMALARLEDDGDLDNTFDGDGRMEVALPGDQSATDLLRGQFGEYYVAGSQSSPSAEFVLAQVRQDGGMGTGFTADGVLTGTTPASLVDIAFESNSLGAPLVTLGNTSGGDLALLSVSTAAVPESGFGTAGLKVIDLGGADQAHTLLALYGKTYIVAGSSGGALGLVRLDEHATPLAGPTLTPLDDLGAASAEALALRVAPDVPVETLLTYPTSGALALAFTRHFFDLTLDAGGRQAVDFGNSSGYSYYPNNEDLLADALFQPDGKLVVAGESQASTDGDSFGVLARFTTAGLPDPTFGVNGQTIVPSMTVAALTRLPDGKFIAAGYDFRLARLDGAGGLDLSFSGDGYASAEWANTQTGALLRQADGKLVIAGTLRGMNNTGSVALARFLPTGELDPDFGLDGKVVTGVGLFSMLLDLAQTPQGKLVAVGATASDPNNLSGTLDLLVMRFSPDGQPDNTVGDDGVVLTDFGSGEIGFALALMDDGRIVAGGASIGQGMAFARYLTNGDPDATFSGDGRQRITLLGQDIAADLVLRGDKIVAADCDQTNFASLAVRLTGQGTLDSTFSGNGSAPFDFAAADCALALAMQGERIALAGTAVGGSKDFVVAMYSNAQPRLFLPLLVR
jgi:uncharacterized delta-60 repeat protein